MKKLITSILVIGFSFTIFSIQAMAAPGGWGRTKASSGRPSIDTNKVPGVYTETMTTQYIKKEMARFDAVGLSIALVNENGIIWEKGFGWADKENKVPAGPESVYMHGSCSKFLTAVNLVRLHEQGIINIDHPATDYLPEFQMIDRYPGTFQQITVRRLLNQHSGIPGDIYTAGFLLGEGWDKWGPSLYMDWLTDYLKSDYPSLPPGKLGVYSNISFALAGEIAVKKDGLPGESFPAYMERILFTPLGMNHSSFKAIHENLAIGYVGGMPIPIKETNCSFGATGGAYTTVGDMAKLMTMIINQGKTSSGQQYLRPETVAMLGESEKSILDINTYGQYGLGLDTVNDPALSYAGRAWAKNGSTGDYNAYFEILPDLKLGAVVLSNSDTAGALVYGAVNQCLQNAVFEAHGLVPTPPALPTYPSISDRAVISGIYVKTTGYDRVENNGDGTLNWIMNANSNTPQTRQLFFDGTAFVSPDRTETISFITRQWDEKEHMLMIQSGSSGSLGDEIMYGGHVRKILSEKISFPAIPDAWHQRTGFYVNDNMPWNDAFLLESGPFSLITEKDGLLMLNYTDTLYPESDDIAFVAGVTSRSDSCVRVVTHDGKTKLLNGGNRFYSIDQVPAIAAGDTVSGNVDIFKSDWYRFEAEEAGKTITVTTQSNYYLTLYDSSYALVARQKGALSWTSTGDNYYFCITPTPDAGKTYTLTLNSQKLTARIFPVLEVSGSHYDIGYAVGSIFREQISQCFENAANMLNTFKAFIAVDPGNRYDGLKDAVIKTYPGYWQELQGMADGSGSPLENFMILSSISEYIYMIGSTTNPSHGCSTVSYADGDNLYLAHNEDAFYSNHDLMFVVKAHPDGKPSFINFCYPGMIMGLAPAMNDKGIFYSGNYITGTSLNPGGIPNSFIQRSLMEATTLDQAITLATVPNRAYSFHASIGSTADKRIVSLEVTPDSFYQHEVNGFYAHTNHFFQPGMEELSHPNDNSVSRLTVLKNQYEETGNSPKLADGNLLTQFLSSHENEPDNPCVHGNDGEPYSTQTLGSSLFNITDKTWKLYHNQPCDGIFQVLGF
jgi:CubicO group peptidase (beta-lactamase class C family)